MEKTEKIAKPVVVKRKVEEPESESESESESEPELSQDSEKELDNNIVDQSDSVEDEEGDSEEDSEEDDDEPISYDNSIVGDFTLPIKETKNTTELKPLVITNKPSHMEIRQINLDELKDMSELPIEAKLTSDETNSDVNKKKMMKNDAFFLDSNGNEVQSSTRFDPGLDQAPMDDESYYYSGGRRNWNNQTNYSQARRDYGASSSFKSSLDAKSNSYSNGNYRNYNKQEHVNNRGFCLFFYYLYFKWNDFNLFILLC